MPAVLANACWGKGVLRGVPRGETAILRHSKVYNRTRSLSPTSMIEGGYISRVLENRKRVAKDEPKIIIFKDEEATGTVMACLIDSISSKA